MAGRHGFGRPEDVRRVIRAARDVETKRVSDEKPLPIYRPGEEIGFALITEVHPTYERTYVGDLISYKGRHTDSPVIDSEPVPNGEPVLVQGLNMERLSVSTIYAIVAVTQFEETQKDKTTKTRIVYKAIIGEEAGYPYSGLGKGTGGCNTRVTVRDPYYSCTPEGQLKVTTFYQTFGVCSPVVYSSVPPGGVAVPLPPPPCVPPPPPPPP